MGLVGFSLLEDGCLFVAAGVNLVRLEVTSGRSTNVFGLAEQWYVRGPYAVCCKPLTIIDLRSGARVELAV